MQSREEVETTINRIFEKLFEVEPEKLLAGAKLQDLGLDSLDSVDIVVALEKSFRFRISEEEARRIRTLGDIYGSVMSGLERLEGKPA